MTLRRVSWAAAAALLLADLFLHKPISDLCDAMLTRYGWETYNRAVLVIICSGSGGIALALLLRDWRRWCRPAAFGSMLGVSALTYLMHRWMLVANIELIHYPQYGLIAAVLLLGGNTPNAAWLGATGAGAVDEVYQQLVIYAGRPDTYLDFNDMVLNAIGATWAVLLLAGLSPTRPADTRDHPRHRRAFMIAVLPMFAVALWLDPPQLTALFRHTPMGREFHVMSASEGLLAAAALWFLAHAGSGVRPASRPG